MSYSFRFQQNRTQIVFRKTFKEQNEHMLLSGKHNVRSDTALLCNSFFIINKFYPHLICEFYYFSILSVSISFLMLF